MMSSDTPFIDMLPMIASRSRPVFVRCVRGLHLTAALLLIGLLSLLSGPTAFAQTGPGGVGNAAGTNGQPANLLWLQGDEGITTSGSSVTDWLDQSGNGNDVSEAGSPPAFTPGGLNGVDLVTFDGNSGQYLQRSAGTFLNGADAFTMLAVVRAGATGQEATFLDSDGDGPDGQDDNPNLRYDANGTNSSRINIFKSGVDVSGGNSDQSLESSETVGSLAVQSTDPRLYTLQWESGTDLRFFLNALEDNATNGTSSNGTTSNGPFLDGNTATGTLNSSDQILVGNGTKGTLGSDGWSGDVAEVVVFRSALNAAQRRIVNTYLNEKYGLTTDAGASVEPYAFGAAFFNDFAGIGQANNGTSHTNAQSSALQLLNPQGLNNGEFLLFGHDGADASTYTTAEVPGDGSISERIAREWRIDETNGDVGALTMQVDAADLPPLSTGQDYYLLTDSDGDFTSGATATRLTLDSGSNYNADINLADADYVTLGIGARAATPQNLTAASDRNQRTLLNWDAVSTDRTGAPTTLTGDQYRIYQNTTSDFSTATQVATSTTTNDVEVTGLINGTSYFFWVTAVNDVGESNAQATPASATPDLNVSFEVASSTGSEKGDADGFTVELSDTNSQNVIVDLSIAAAGGSIQSVSSITSIDNGGNGYAVDDIIGENDTGDGGSNLQIHVTSVDGSGAVTGATILNGGSGYTRAPASFTTLSGSGTGASFSVTLQAAASDFTLQTTTVQIPSDNLTRTLNNSDLTFNDDSIPEDTETVVLMLSNPRTSNGAGPTLGAQSTHNVTISDDDFVRKVFLVDNLGTSDDGLTSAPEENTVTYTIETSSVDPTNDTVIDWIIDLDEPATTATAADFTATSGTTTLTAGQSSTTFNLPVDDDAVFEPDEDAVVRLVEVTNANINNNQNDRFTSLTHTIENSADGQPQVRFNAAASTLPDESTAPSIQVDLTSTSSEDIDVSLAATGGTATGSGTDYTLATTTLTIPAGQSSITVEGTDLAIVDDALDEDDETVVLTLQGVTSGSATVNGSSDTHTLTITDDDPLPTVAFDVSSSSVQESAGSAQIALSLSGESGRNVIVNYSTGGTATGSGVDYSDDDGGTVTIDAGDVSTAIDLSLVDDAESESNETVALSFSGADLTNADAGGITSHTFTIVDEDFGSTGPGGVGNSDSNLLWLRADAIEDLADGNPLPEWVDESGNGHDQPARLVA